MAVVWNVSAVSFAEYETWIAAPTTLPDLLKLHEDLFPASPLSQTRVRAEYAAIKLLILQWHVAFPHESAVGNLIKPLELIGDLRPAGGEDQYCLVFSLLISSHFHAAGAIIMCIFSSHTPAGGLPFYTPIW